MQTTIMLPLCLKKMFTACAHGGTFFLLLHCVFKENIFVIFHVSCVCTFCSRKKPLTVMRGLVKSNVQHDKAIVCCAAVVYIAPIWFLINNLVTNVIDDSAVSE